MPSTIISAQNLTCNYNSTRAINDIYFKLCFKPTIIASVIFSVISVIGGILFFTFNLPAGGTIVIFNAVFLAIVLFAKKMLQT